MKRGPGGQTRGASAPWATLGSGAQGIRGSRPGEVDVGALALSASMAANKVPPAHAQRLYLEKKINLPSPHRIIFSVCLSVCPLSVCPIVRLSIRPFVRPSGI
jgi:hypothetical protein